jgi:nicotinamide mononucleotide adenylyltransferase
MVNLALKDNNWIKLDKWESEQKEWTKTLNVLTYYQEKYLKLNDNIKLMLLCGADLLESFNIPGLWLDEHVKLIYFPSHTLYFSL